MGGAGVIHSRSLLEHVLTWGTKEIKVKILLNSVCVRILLALLRAR